MRPENKAAKVTKRSTAELQTHMSLAGVEPATSPYIGSNSHLRIKPRTHSRTRTETKPGLNRNPLPIGVSGLVRIDFNAIVENLSSGRFFQPPNRIEDQC